MFCSCSEYTYVFTLLYYFCCNIVACSLIYSHEILGIWCSIPQTANGKDVVRAPGNLSSVSPHFSWGLRPCGLNDVRFNP
jgi:hypothetical protein